MSSANIDKSIPISHKIVSMHLISIINIRIILCLLTKLISFSLCVIKFFPTEKA